MNKKIILVPIIVLAIFVVAFAFLYFYLGGLPSQSPASDYGGEEKYFTWSGAIQKIDSKNKIITAKIDLVTNILSGSNSSYENKTVNFVVGPQTEIYRIQYPKGYNPDQFASNPNKFLAQYEKEITLNDLKTNNQISIYVDDSQMSKTDNFLVSKIVLRIFNQ